MSGLLLTEKNPNLVYDVGLHRGQDTDFYLKNGFTVVGFEADPGNAEFCRTRFVNEIADGRLVIVEGAITADIPPEGGTSYINFYRNVDHSYWGSSSEEWAKRNEVMGTENVIIPVRAIDFAHCLEKYGIPFYLKADIVGSETICLQALRNFENKPDYISIRSEKLVFSKLEYEFELLKELGYDGFKAVKQNFECIKAKLPSNEVPEFYTFEDGSSGPFGEATPGKWKSSDEVLRKYKRIFVKYWLFGDYSYMIQTVRGRWIISSLERILRRSIPGWYDTHARHTSAFMPLLSFAFIQ